MDNMACTKMKSVVQKVKKKPVKDEVDHLKQAKKKKRRLEKALATSAAICLELEKKKQKKKEEQQKLDEEGAAVAEAVALHVLFGEDSDDPFKITLKKDMPFNSWDCTKNIDLFTSRKGANFYQQGSTKCSCERIGWVSNVHGAGYEWRGLGYCDGPSSYDTYEVWGNTGFSAGLSAAQAVSSLRIADDARDTIVLNGMLRG